MTRETRDLISDSPISALCSLTERLGQPQEGDVQTIRIVYEKHMIGYRRYGRDLQLSDKTWTVASCVIFSMLDCCFPTTLMLWGGPVVSRGNSDVIATIGKQTMQLIAINIDHFLTGYLR